MGAVGHFVEDRTFRHMRISSFRRWVTIFATSLACTLPAFANDTQAWRGPHAADLEAHRDHPVLADLVGDGTRPSLPLPAASKTASAAPVVFGFLPYWIDQTYYQQLDFSLLTHIAAFSVEVTPEGRISNDRGWPWTALVDSAHAHGVRVILTATLFGDSQVLELITDETHRQRFFGEIRDQLLVGNADGVNIDFEGPGANGWPSSINDFMAQLTHYLHAEIPGCEVSFAAPPVDWAGRWDFPGLAASCDYLFVMGYAFTGSWSDRAGPTSPLHGGSRNITTTIDGDYGEVTRESPEKLVLGIPYYGCEWTTTGPDARSSTMAFVRYPQIWATFLGATTHDSHWDSVSDTPWYRYQDGDQWVQVWYDDVASLGMKFDLALDRRLRGVGMWALGYESRRREPWGLLQEKIGRRGPATLVAGNTPAPGGLRLQQNYPNPFNGSTRLQAEVPAAGQVEISIFDILGQRVRVWQQRSPAPGTVVWVWDGLDGAGQPVASGVYTYRLRFGDVAVDVRELTGRMMLAR